MKKNIILALIMAASMTATMTSCGKTGEEVSNGTEQSSYNEAMGIIDSEVTGAVVTPHDVIAPEALDIEPTQEILDADIDSCKIQLGNKVYTLPVTLQTLLDDGATITNGVNPINDVVDAANNALGSHRGITVAFSVDSMLYEGSFWNYFEEKKQAKDCFLCDTSSSNLTNRVIYAKGIRIGSSIDELKSAWGEPTIDDLNEYYYYDEYSYLDDGKYDATGQKYSYKILIDLEKQTITDIVYYMDYDYYNGNVENLVDDNESSETSAEKSESESPKADEESTETSATDE
ncbi:hypothetical protein [Ruminococcus sp. HUN007]|uniref:hypothetical protein n=1 Tax=Ruminococcus sp. HUN007 TaxID=1514668 RepID=UPI000B323BF1|nr:hypothetical protein [Ruminococcus sp. HUN007]